MKRRSVNFTVDAALLRELGERLVGKPQIALAELIKNAYDADARNVRIEFTGDTIVIDDNGHGMSATAFTSYWMRVGTTHKAAEKVSPELGRPLTGSKGVGRLAAQLLATDLKIESVALTNPALAGFDKRVGARSNQRQPPLTARIDWQKARSDEQLTSIKVPITEGGDEPELFVGNSRVGTRLTLSNLSSSWSEVEFRALAREIWALQPPFEVDENDEQAFRIELVSDYDDVIAEFREQMLSIFDNWQGRIHLALEDDDPELDVLFDFDPLKNYEDDESDEEPSGEESSATDTRRGAPKHAHAPPGIAKLLRITIELRDDESNPRDLRVRVPNCPVDLLDANILIFNLTHRQAHGISVKTARDYMRTFGGVHLYDDKFRLPYYGPEDWLHIERDHARRLSRSRLLPESLRVAKGLHDLPSRRRIFGTATISTAHEQQTAPARQMRDADALSIQINRDRLSDNLAFSGLRSLVRLGLDLYATEVARAKTVKTGRGRDNPAPPPRPKDDIKAAIEAVQTVQEQIAPEQFESINDYLSGAEHNAKLLEDTANAQASLFGTLATVGMTTLAWEHEATKQRLIVLDAAKALRLARNGTTEALEDAVDRQAQRLEEAAERMNDVARLFRPVLDRESRENRAALRARRFIQRTVEQLSVLSRGATVSTGSIPKDLRLPPGTYSAWVSIFQNLLVNAFNAVLDQPDCEVLIDAGTSGKTGWVRIQDTGVGVDLAEAEEYFQPFVRGLKDDPRRAALGLGGSGLGLTIVRMIGDSIGVTVRFVPPQDGFSTAVTIEWKSDD